MEQTIVHFVPRYFNTRLGVNCEEIIKAPYIMDSEYVPSPSTWFIEDCRDAIDWKDVNSTIKAIEIKMIFFNMVLCSLVLAAVTSILDSFSFNFTDSEWSFGCNLTSLSELENPVLTFPDDGTFEDIVNSEIDNSRAEFKVTSIPNHNSTCTKLLCENL